jgi:hypothetical protein
MAYKMKQFLTLCFRSIALQDANRVAVYPHEWLAKRGTPRPLDRPHGGPSSINTALLSESADERSFRLSYHTQMARTES